MKKMILFLSFLVAAMFFVTSGCDSDSKDNNNLLGLLVLTSGAVPATAFSGEPGDVTSAGGAAASAMNAANQFGSMYSFISPGFSVAPAEGTYLPKDIKESAMASVQGTINDRLMAISGDCDGLEQTIEGDDIDQDDITAAVTLPTGMTITAAALHVTGTYKCTEVDEYPKYYHKMNSSLQITGSMSVTYTTSTNTLSVFDIAGYLEGGKFGFSAPTVVGTVNMTDIDRSFTTYVFIDIDSTGSGPYNYGYNYSGSMNLSGSIALNGGSLFEFSLSEEDKQKYDLKAESIDGGKPVVQSKTGYVTLVINGTVGTNPVSVSYGFKNEDMISYMDAL